jgi:MoaA/NifB/PqqE/SkfB family radical SAM enzyme
MCDIWKEKNKSDLSIDTVKKILDAQCLDEKLDITLTGGELFLHKGWGQITDAILTKNPQWLKGISTNGTRKDDVLRFLHDFSKRLPSDFSFHISLDGINCHDAQRGKSLGKVIDTIHAIKDFHPTFGIKIKFTITAVNYTDIIPTFRFCQENRLDFKAKLVEYAENYTNRLDRRAFMFDDAAKRAIIRDLIEVSKEKFRSRDGNAAFIVNTIRYLQGDHRRAVCKVPSQRVFLMPEGDVFTCIHFPKIGNLRNKSLDKIWTFSTAEKHRDTVKQEGCPGCISYHGVTHVL